MLHLTTAANGAESFYESGPDTPRTEGAQACSLVINPRMEGVQANPNPNPNPIPNPHPHPHPHPNQVGTSPRPSRPRPTAALPTRSVR